jgi:hypothetical protein
MTKFSQKNLTLLHSKEISQISLRISCLHKLKNKLIQTVVIFLINEKENGPLIHGFLFLLPF